MMTVWWLLSAAAGVSLGLTWLLRRYALARSLIDIPNQRSSHYIPTPRSGNMVRAALVRNIDQRARQRIAT